MADWHGNRSNERWIFRKVSWPNYVEGDEIWQATGGSIENSALSELRSSGSIDFEGASNPDDGKTSMVRVYYGFEDDEGSSAEEAVATLFYECTEVRHKGGTVSGTLACNSPLKVLSDRFYGYPKTVKRGVNAVKRAKEMLVEAGLKANCPDAGEYELREDRTFKGDVSWLEIVNELLLSAGYDELRVDAYGTVQVREAFDPECRAAAWAFSDGERSIMYPEVTHKEDWREAHNVVRLNYWCDRFGIYGYAKNVSEENAMSVPNLGREKTLNEEESDLPGEEDEFGHYLVQSAVETLKSRAAKRLKEEMTSVEHVKISHAFVPIGPQDAVDVDYTGLGERWHGFVENMRIQFSPAAPCETTVVRSLDLDLEIETGGGIIFEKLD